MKELYKLNEALNKAVEEYKAEPTKARSKRVRMALGDIKTNTASLRAALVEADKAGY